MDRHDCGFGAHSKHEGREQNLEHFCAPMPGQKTTWDEVEVTRKGIGPGDCEEEEDAGRKKVGKILSACHDCFGGFFMDNQWISRNGEHFIEYEEGQEVAGKGNAHCSGKAKCKAEEVSSLGVLLEPPHVTNGIKGGQNPEARCYQREVETKGIYPELERETWEDFYDCKLHHLSVHNRWEQRGHQTKLCNCSQQGPKLPDIGAAIRRKYQKCCNQRHQYAEGGSDGVNDFHWPISSPV